WAWKKPTRCWRNGCFPMLRRGLTSSHKKTPNFYGEGRFGVQRPGCARKDTRYSANTKSHPRSMKGLTSHSELLTCGQGLKFPRLPENFQRSPPTAKFGRLFTGWA